jgi:tetratricopeptide (TPR) repeat protein
MRAHMKTILIILAIALCGIGSLAQETNTQNSSSSVQSADLAEADRLESLASASFSKRDYKAAGEFLKRSLALKEKALGADHPDVATTLHNLANVYQKAGKYDDAEPLYLRAISIRESRLGASHPDSVQLLKDYACMKKFGSDKANEQIRIRMIKRAHCLFAGLDVDCSPDSAILVDGILNAKVSSWVLPHYPKGANVTQQISVYVTVSEEGKVLNAYAPCGDPLLRKAAVDAAWQAKTKPRMINGKPTKVRGVLIYNFVHQ